MDNNTALVKYIFLDIVRFSHERTIEAQTEIIKSLNSIVLETAQEFRIPKSGLLYLPTGDGICICLINVIDPFDVHILIAFKLLERLAHYNLAQSDERRKFKIRIGINENHDNIVIDINGKRNVAGAGINTAQRIMDMADGNQIYVGQSVYEKLVQRDQYYDNFIKVPKQIKHNVSLVGYRYLDGAKEFLDSSIAASVNVIERRIPKSTAIYFALLQICQAKITQYSGLGSNKYSLINIICYMTKDILKFETLDAVEKATWTSFIFDKDISTFDAAFRKIESSYFWLICDSSNYLKRELEINAWSELFSNSTLSPNLLYASAIEKEWPDIKAYAEHMIRNIYVFGDNNGKIF